MNDKALQVWLELLIDKVLDRGDLVLGKQMAFELLDRIASDHRTEPAEIHVIYKPDL